MKAIVMSFVCIIFFAEGNAQLKASAPVCPTMTADILAGNVNKVHSKSTIGEVIKTFPCFTDKAETDSLQCTRVSYKDKGIQFFPGRNYIEIDENFKGSMKPALIGLPRGSLFGTLGHPKMKDANWDAYQTQYGTLVVYYNKAGKINKLQMSSRTTESMKLCE